MPRKTKLIRATAKLIQKSRGNWYAFHFENRAKAKTLSPEQLHTYQMVARWAEAPQMTMFGGVPENYPERKVYELSNQYGLDANLVNPWYLSEEGWDAFQSLWLELPEPVDLYTGPCVQIGDLSTLYTMPVEAEVRS